MMKIDILKSNYFTTTGSSVLKMIQNKDMPTLDLIVREAIQNSLDAAINTASSVKVNFEINRFKTSELAFMYEKITNDIILQNDFESSFLSIRDSNTIGLTGDLKGKFSSNEPNQNLGKLVFHIMKPQEKEGAGGSWGIGKTVYYRVGKGIVIYYSRIKLDNGLYQQRLISVLVENETNENGLLKNEKDNIGVAFFGDIEDGSIKAITNDENINNILKIFNIRPFTGNETGTNIIIPFIDEKQLLDSAMTENTSQNWWSNSLANYLEVSILRWYFPRMASGYNYGPKLLASINDNVVEPKIETPLFAKLMELYSLKDEKSIPKGIFVEEITRSQNVQDNLLGKFIYTKINNEDLGKKANLTASYLQFENIKDNEFTPPLVAFTRKPGMVVNYKMYDNLTLNCNPNEKIIGVFILNSNNYITHPVKINLNEYIRQSEKADHTSWADHSLDNKSNKVLIVDKIYRTVNSALSKSFGKDENESNDLNLDTFLGNLFGKMVLPDEGFGNAGSDRVKKTPPTPGKRNVGKGISTVNKNKIILDNIVYEQEYISLTYEITLKTDVKRIVFKNKIETVGQLIDPISWENLGLNYPCNIRRIVLIKGNDNSSVKLFKSNEKLFEFNNFKGDFLYTEQGKCYGIGLNKIENKKQESFNIRIVFETTDRQLRTIFENQIIEVGNE